MLGYIVGRLARMIPQIFLISILAFIIINCRRGIFHSQIPPASTGTGRS
jgi:ABC-type dipeptide/oligopeptide/nickel transport system permease component